MEKRLQAQIQDLDVSKSPADQTVEAGIDGPVCLSCNEPGLRTAGVGRVEETTSTLTSDGETIW